MIQEHLPPLTLRMMTTEDVNPVYALDKLAFPTPWPLSTYYHELNNSNTRLFILECDAPASNGHRPAWLHKIFPASKPPTHKLIGYSGMWHIVGEVHISTIAVDPYWQGHKLGELLLWNMARQAMYFRADMVTLEVRVSNVIAQNLYRKYGFEIVGRRKGYYRDNGEDAYLMTVQPLDQAYRSWLINRGHELARMMTLHDLARE